MHVKCGKMSVERLNLRQSPDLFCLTQNYLSLTSLFKNIKLIYTCIGSMKIDVAQTSTH